MIIQAHNEGNRRLVAVRLARYLHSRCEEENERRTEDLSVLSPVVRLGIFSSLYNIAQYLFGSSATTLAGVLRVFEVDWRCITPGFHFRDCQCRTTVVVRCPPYTELSDPHYATIETKKKRRQDII